MNPTPNQITECTDERQLCEWAAVYCLGLRLRQHPYDSSVSAFFNHEDLYTPVITQEDYQPTSPTEKGKAQCWDLAMKYGLVVEFNDGDYCAHYSQYYMGQSKGHVEHDNPQIAVVKAALLCAMGD